MEDNEPVADITFVVIDNAYLFISSLSVRESSRGQLEGIKMLRRAAEYARKMGIDLIRLDDMSDHYRKSRNIYVRAGFHYDSPDGCEMSGRVSHISTQCKKIIQQPRHAFGSLMQQQQQQKGL